ncbi:2-isopropylmalate synthase [hydrothermal vent metagenome]|uniref:2-isopropylmalate synthase n=1 Tax=hydrothermal vent metagenome TaxID=652676 RepID=A0A1W1CRS1_9ZZZZ
MKESNEWNAQKYNKHAEFVSNLAMPLIDILQPKAQEKILDLGCGEGTLAEVIQEYKCEVIGVDLSADMVEKAKAKNIEAYVMSATELAYENEFDAVFSNAVLHWVQDANLAIQEVKKVLKKEGRFVAEFGGYENLKYLINAIEVVFEKHPEYGGFNNPWYFPRTDEYKKLLEENGFEVELIEIVNRPTPIDDIYNWLSVFANGIIENIPTDKHENFKNEVRELLKSKIYTQEDGWIVDYVRLKFKAIKV